MACLNLGVATGVMHLQGAWHDTSQHLLQIPGASYKQETISLLPHATAEGMDEHGIKNVVCKAHFWLNHAVTADAPTDQQHDNYGKHHAW